MVAHRAPGLLFCGHRAVPSINSILVKGDVNEDCISVDRHSLSLIVDVVKVVDRDFER
jgi:hypothetical protein